ncbi:hypothetical protein WMF26_01755 [Sorangium sp. So ce185]|uniref:hypothetical protein n=1 Tax=Sorangium sp. So ce185 TaxID=3133287 RepID=UPI003F62DE9C
MRFPGRLGRLLRACAAAAVCLAPAGCVFYTRLSAYAPSPTAADIAGGLSDGALRVHAITSSRAVTSVIRDAFRGPRFVYSEEVVEDNSAQRDPGRDLCALLERSGAELLLVASDELAFAGGAPERDCLRRETVPSGKPFPEADPLVSVCVEHEDSSKYEARRARYGELTSVVQLVTPARCERPPALGASASALSGTPERIREQLADLLPRAAVVEARGERAWAQAIPGSAPSVGGEARVPAREGDAAKTGVVTEVTGDRAEVRSLWPDRPFAPKDGVVFGGPLWGVAFVPEARVSVGNAVSAGVALEAYRAHHGPLLGLGVHGVVGTSGPAGVGGFGGHLYAGYVLWPVPTRLGLYMRGHGGVGSVRAGGDAETFGFVGLAAGVKWRVPSIVVIDASGGYDLGPSATVSTGEPARTIAFAWRGPAMRLTLALDL